MGIKSLAPVVAATLLWAGVSAAQPPQPRAPIREFDVPTTERLGREIYRQDRAAWLATDALQAKHPDLAAAGVIGWLVAPPAPDGDHVLFLKGSAQHPEIAYDIDVPSAGQPTVADPAVRTLSADQLAEWTARSTAIAHMGPVCRAGYNTAMTRDPAGSDWLVWLLAPSPSTGAIPVGGHYRFTITPDGSTVKQRDALFASCLVIDGKPPANGRPVAAFATHVVSPTPVETHVFLQLEAGQPLYVGTPTQHIWSIDKGRMQDLGPSPQAGH